MDPIGCSGSLAFFFYNNDFNITIIFQSNLLIDIATVYKRKTINLTIFMESRFQKTWNKFGND